MATMATRAGKNQEQAVRRANAGEALRDYESKRDFSVTGEPAPRGRGARQASARALRFVVQKHDARRLHYDFRLELDGTLKSWAVPKGPSLDPHVKRLAVQVEDHPLEYAGFEGRIPAGEYGGGEVIVWDRGEWQALDSDPAAAYRAGRLKFELHGEKLAGGWMLVRTNLPGSVPGSVPGSDDKEQWLLIKENDAAARAAADYDVLAARPESVLTQRELTPRLTGKAKPAKGPDEKAAKLDKAKPAALPPRIFPELATLVDGPPSGDWRYEIKFDGYRLLARIDAQAVRLFTRNGLDWTDKLPALAQAVGELSQKRGLKPSLNSGWLDGEIVMLDSQGLPDFQALQNAFELGHSGRSDEIVYFLFDLPYYDGLDLSSTPLEQRRALLKRLIETGDSDRLRYSADIPAGGGDILQGACALKLEGVIGKRAGSPYVSRRSSDWIKLKCKQRQEFVIAGYTPPQGGRSGFGALLLGVHDHDAAAELRYVGRVGTGFSEASLRTLHAQMVPLAREAPPFAEPPKGRAAAGVTWLAPRLLCEVEFSAWTREGIIRHAVFHGLRDDKPVRKIVRERVQEAPQEAARKTSQKTTHKTAGRAASQTAARPEIAGVGISHPERVIDSASGTTKLALAAFYRDIAAYLLPQIAGRPLSILRAPTGVGGEQFFQRHAEKLSIPGVRLLKAVSGSDDEPLMAIDDLDGLIGAVQMGCIEFHPWNSDAKHIDRPDRLILDLDPDPALPWSRMVEATKLVLAVLDELGLQAFLKTSGGKGMHIVVPLARRHDWAQVKAFSKGVASHLTSNLPQRFADRMGAQNRVGKIFVDYLRNQKGGSTAAAYSVRARPGLAVSVPIARRELDDIAGSTQWSVANLADRLASLDGDPWAGYANTQSLSRAMLARLGLK